jgi:hypothetical protein
VYFGAGAVIKKVTQAILATLPYYQELQSELRGEIIEQTGTKLTAVRYNSNPTIIEGVEYYEGSVTYTTYPPQLAYVPPEPIISYNEDDGIIGFTLDGRAVMSTGSKGVTRSVSLTSDRDPTGGDTVGGIKGSYPSISEQLVSKSKSNGRTINGTVYYDWSYTKTLWT